MPTDPFNKPISEYIWDTKYRYYRGHHAIDVSVEDTWRRVAHALASVEADNQKYWEENFFNILKDFRFLPGGRILAGAGTEKRVTLFNCFVMGVIEDSMDGIFDALKEAALTMQQGGGIGYDFSTLRPRGTQARSAGTIASGPVSFMHIWDSMCKTLLSTGHRRGAMVATLRCDHPDIESYIDVKKDPASLRHLNLSVQVTDAFMRAVRDDEEWPLVFPVTWLDERDTNSGAGWLWRQWPGMKSEVRCKVFRVVRARDLWQHIMQATYHYAEPGVLFVDRINHSNNLWYRERITSTNPCGEVPLPPYGACNLGSINVTQFVKAPFTPHARLDMEAIRSTAETAIRLLDNVIDLSQFPLKKQKLGVFSTRRIGLGITGLGDTLILLGLHYADEASLKLASEVMQSLCHTAYRTSIELAREKGVFPKFEKSKFIQGEFIKSLPEDIKTGISKTGIRNSHLLAIAPAGTISLLANNVSSGIEPVFDFKFQRRIYKRNANVAEFHLVDYAYQLWQQHYSDAPLPRQFVHAKGLPPKAHLKMQAALQPFVDNAISKTINVPEDIDFSSFRTLYEEAYALGLKGCTTFRPNPVSGAILVSPQSDPSDARCCLV